MQWNVKFHVVNSHGVNKKYKLLLTTINFSFNDIINQIHFELFPNLFLKKPW